MKFRSFSLVGMAISLSLAATSSAVARDELIVEAQRRAEPIQDVPLAVSGFGTEDIAKLQIHSTQDIGANVPNLQTYAVTANGAAMQIHARGASVQNPGFNVSESPVGLYVDDVYYGRLATANLDLNDIERIEVLRGPQATLYGRNTIAGAIKAYSRKPGDDFWASGTIGYGKYETAKITASVGGPIKEGSLAGSISGLYHDRGEGFQGNALTGENPGEFENKSVRGKLHWYGGDIVDATLSVWAVDVQNDGYNGVPYVPFQLNPPAVIPPGNTDVTLDPLAAANGSPIDGFYDTRSPPGANYGATDQAGVTLDMTFNFSDSLDLRSITAYADIDDEFGFDLAGGGFFVDIGDPAPPNIPPPGTIIGPVPGLLISSDSRMETWSQEFQLLGNSFSDRLDWIVGLYFLNEDGSQNYAGNTIGFGFLEVSDSDTTSYAVYAEGTWNFTDRLSLTAGGRWSQDDKKYDLTCTGICAPATDGSNSIALDDDWSNFSPKLSLNSEIGDNLLMYLSVANGFQAGGFQTLCFGNLQCAEATFDPQEVWSYEYGFKSDWFDNSLRANVALFYAQYEDIQQTVPRFDTNGNLAFPTENVGDVDVWGIELETIWVPIDNLNIFGNLGWMDSDTVKTTGDFGPVTRELPSNPDLTFRLGADYTISVSSSLDVFFGADMAYTDEYFNDINNSFIVDDYTRFNAFLGLGRPDGRWQLVGEWRNLTNEEDNVSGLLLGGFTNMRTILPPLEYMVTLKVNY